MKPKLIHVVNSLVTGGVEQGILTLLRQGFYDSFDFRFVELYEGKTFIHDEIAKAAGPNRFTSLYKEDKFDPYNPQEAFLAKNFRKTCKMFRLTYRLENIFRELKPDTVLLSGFLAQTVGRSAAVFSPETKVISFEHNAVSSNFLLGAILRLTSLRNDAVFGDTLATVQDRDTYYVKRQSAYVVPLVMLEPDASHQIRQPDVFKISSLGRLVPQKNYLELIHAIAELMREGRALELTIGGDGEQRQEVEALIHKLDRETPAAAIAGRIRLTGWLEDEASRHALRSASDIYIQPSRHEGFCIAVVEALADGIPTIATDFAGTHEYGNAENLLKIKSSTSADIADGLRYMMDHYSNIAPEMSRAALETTRTLYNESAVRNRWHAAIDALASPRRPSFPGAMPGGHASADHHYVR